MFEEKAVQEVGEDTKVFSEENETMGIKICCRCRKGHPVLWVSMVTEKQEVNGATLSATYLEDVLGDIISSIMLYQIKVFIGQTEEG